MNMSVMWADFPAPSPSRSALPDTYNAKKLIIACLTNTRFILVFINFYSSYSIRNLFLQTDTFIKSFFYDQGILKREDPTNTGKSIKINYRKICINYMTCRFNNTSSLLPNNFNMYYWQKVS